MPLVVYQLHNPDDQLNGWHILFDNDQTRIIFWSDLQHDIKLPKRLKDLVKQENDFPIILKRREDAEKIVKALDKAKPKLVQEEIVEPYQVKLHGVGG